MSKNKHIDEIAAALGAERMLVEGDRVTVDDENNRVWTILEIRGMPPRFSALLESCGERRVEPTWKLTRKS